MKRIALLFAGLLAGQFLAAQKYSNEFLAIGAGARAQGMGNAAAVSTQDAYAGYWNPAGLVGVAMDGSDLQLAFMHAEWFAGVGQYDFLSGAYPLFGTDGGRRQVVGLSVLRFAVDDIPNTLSLYESDGTVNYDNIRPFSAADYAVLMSYAQDIGKKTNGEWFIGGNAKVIYRRIGPFAKAFGFGLDFGARYQMDKWSFGLSAKDVTSTFNAWSIELSEEEEQVLELQHNEIPINAMEVTRPWFTLGAAFRHRWGKAGILAEVDGVLTTDGKRNTLLSGNTISVNPALGLELDYKELVYLRVGLNNFQRETSIQLEKNWTMAPTLGVGLKIKRLSLDYAFTDVSGTAQRTYSHVISLLFDMDFDVFRRHK